MSDPLVSMAALRRARTTTAIYDASYWEGWKERFKVTHDPKHPTVIFESKKKATFIVDMLHLTGGSILDVGCGVGMFPHFMQSLGWMSKGLEPSAEARELAPESFRGHIRQGVVTAIPADLGTFDVVTAFDVMEHLFIEEIFKAVCEIERVATKAFVMRTPIDGYLCEGGIPDLAAVSSDIGHVGIYTWEFWVRRFTEHGKFRFLNCVLWDCQSAPGSYMEAWLTFVKG